MVHTPHRLANRHNHHYHHQRKPVGCPPCESLVSTPTTHATRLRRRTLPASLATPSPARHNGSTNSAQGGSFDARTRPAKGPISHSRQDTQHLHQLSFPLTATKVSTNLFTPPATKLVRPDPSAFASTGLVSKKNRPRPPSCASFVMPDTPCKKSPFFPGSAGATTTVFPSTLPQSFSSAAPDHYADPFRLGKHRNPSLESLKLSKKVHVGGVDCDDLLSTPLSSVKHRGRNNTLVEEYPDSTHSCCSASGGGGGGNDDGGGGSSSISSGLCLTGVKATNLYSQPPPGFHIPAKGKVSESPSSSYIKRSPLSPPSFSLVVGSGDTGAASTSNTNANDFFLDPNTLHRNLLSRRCPGGDDDDDNGDAASETDSTFSSSSTLHPNPRRDGGGPIGPGQPGDSPDGKPGDDLCDSFMFCDSENMQMTTSPVVSDSPKILPTERPQMPQIINGYATNYPHFLRPSYFARNARGPHQFTFLAPPEQLSVEGLGYLEYFEQQFDSLGRIGSGAFSQVYSVRSLDDGSVYAVKKTKTPFEGRKDRQTRLEEVQIMWAVADCPNCVRLVDAWEQYGHLYLQTELCERGTLEQLLDQEADDVGDIETRAWQVLSSIGKGLSRLHSLDIIHLDMKPSNILIGNDGVLKLGDFGHATRLPVRKDKDLEGDREYLAPELLSGSCSKASDVYSLGLILLEIVANIVLPDNGPEWRRLRQGDFSDAHLDALPISPDLRNTIISMLNPDPVLRPSIDAVIAHPKCRTATNILHPL